MFSQGADENDENNLLLQDSHFVNYCKQMYEENRNNKVAMVAKPPRQKKDKVTRADIGQQSHVQKFAGLQSFILKEIAEDSKINERSSSFSSLSSSCSDESSCQHGNKSNAGRSCQFLDQFDD